MEHEQDEYLSVRAAVDLYELTAATLVTRLRNGELPGHKVRGARGREWRVSAADLEEFGYRRRAAREEAPRPDIAELQARINSLRRTVAYERGRADEADRQLGEAAMEIGRLRAALGRAQEGERNLRTDLRLSPVPSQPVLRERPAISG